MSDEYAEAAERAVDRVDALEEENEQLRQRVCDLRDQTEKMNRGAELYQTVARNSAAKRDRQAALVLKHATKVTSAAGRQEYDGGRIQDDDGRTWSGINNRWKLREKIESNLSRVNDPREEVIGLANDRVQQLRLRSENDE